MKPDRFRSLAAARRNPRDCAIGTAAEERAELLDLAADLQRWPCRNVVFREALDRVAQEVARLASRTDEADPAGAPAA